MELKKKKHNSNCRNWFVFPKWHISSVRLVRPGQYRINDWCLHTILLLISNDSILCHTRGCYIIINDNTELAIILYRNRQMIYGNLHVVLIHELDVLSSLTLGSNIGSSRISISGKSGNTHSSSNNKSMYNFIFLNLLSYFFLVIVAEQP
jgi:hypothetical protein